MLTEALRYVHSVTPIPIEEAESGEPHFCPGCKKVVYPVKPGEKVVHPDKPRDKCWHFRLAKGQHHDSIACWRYYAPTTKKTVAASSAKGILDAIMSDPSDGNRGGGGGDGGGEGQVRPFRTVTQMIDQDLHKLPPDVPFGDGSLLCDALIARPSYKRIMDTPEQLHRRILEVRMDDDGIKINERIFCGVVIWGDHQKILVQVTVDDDKLFRKIKDDWYSHERGNDGKYHWNPNYDYMYFACNWNYEPSRRKQSGKYTNHGTLKGTIVARKQVAKGSKKKAKNEKKAK